MARRKKLTNLQAIAENRMLVVEKQRYFQTLPIEQVDPAEIKKLADILVSFERLQMELDDRMRLDNISDKEISELATSVLMTKRKKRRDVGLTREGRKKDDEQTKDAEGEVRGTAEEVLGR